MATATASPDERIPADILATPISDAIDNDLIDSYLSSPPWQRLEGAFNFRSVSHPPMVKPNLIYRSGMLAFLSDEGKAHLSNSLGIRVIFDQRSNEERGKFPDPEIEGIKNVATDISAAGLGFREMKWTSMVDMLLFNLELNHEINRQMFRFALYNRGQPFLIHCTAGKDRTSIAMALLLSIAGVPREDIAYDYALTRVGIEPARDLLRTKVMAGKQVDMNDETLKAIAGCDAASMLEFLDKMDEKYKDGPRGFVRDNLGFSEDEIRQIQQNLRGET